MNNYHDYVFWILVVVTLLATGYTIWVLTQSFDLGIAFAVVFTSIIGMVGWGLIGNTHSVIDVTRNHSVNVIKTPSSIILTINDIPIKTISDVATYNYLSNKTNVLMRENGCVNIYGITNWSADYNVIMQ